MPEETKKTKTRDPYAAIKRLETGRPKMGLGGMAKVEEIADKLAPDHRAVLIADIKKLPPPAAATVPAAGDTQANK